VAHAREQHGPAPQRHAVKIDLHALGGERLGDQVMLADGSAAERHQNIDAGVARLAHCGRGGVELIGHDAEVENFRVLGAQQRRERKRIGGDGAIGPGIAARRHQFVAGGDDGDAGPGCHRNFRVIHGGGERQVASG
jgi:hypothetical protein